MSIMEARATAAFYQLVLPTEEEVS